MPNEKSDYGWAWPLNSPKAHYHEKNPGADTDPKQRKAKAISLCGKMMFLGHDFELGSDNSPDNCVRCKKMLLGDEALVDVRVPKFDKCMRCGRKEKHTKKHVFKDKKWGERKSLPKEVLYNLTPDQMNCWCSMREWKCPECGKELSQKIHVCDGCGYTPEYVKKETIDS
jgi:hypothetical protein